MEAIIKGSEEQIKKFLKMNSLYTRRKGLVVEIKEDKKQRATKEKKQQLSNK